MQRWAKLVTCFQVVCALLTPGLTPVGLQGAVSWSGEQNAVGTRRTDVGSSGRARRPTNRADTLPRDAPLSPSEVQSVCPGSLASVVTRVNVGCRAQSADSAVTVFTALPSLSPLLRARVCLCDGHLASCQCATFPHARAESLRGHNTDKGSV